MRLMADLCILKKVQKRTNRREREERKAKEPNHIIVSMVLVVAFIEDDFTITIFQQEADIRHQTSDIRHQTSDSCFLSSLVLLA